MTGGFFYFEPLRLPESPRHQRTDIARERRAGVVAPYKTESPRPPPGKAPSLRELSPPQAVAEGASCFELFGPRNPPAARERRAGSSRPTDFL